MSKTDNLNNHPLAIAPEAASGITITTDGSANTNASTTVVGGRTYAVTNIEISTGAAVKFGILTTATAANILWTVTPGRTALIYIPEGTILLHHQSTGTSVVCQVARLALKTELT